MVLQKLCLGAKHSLEASFVNGLVGCYVLKLFHNRFYQWEQSALTQETFEGVFQIIPIYSQLISFLKAY